MGDAPPFGLTRPPATSTDSSADAPHPTIIPSTAHLPCTKTHTASTACAPLHRVVHSSSVRLQHTSPTDLGAATTLSCASFAYSHALPHFRPACHLPARETTARMPPPSILLPLSAGSAQNIWPRAQKSCECIFPRCEHTCTTFDEFHAPPSFISAPRHRPPALACPIDRAGPSGRAGPVLPSRAKITPRPDSALTATRPRPTTGSTRSFTP